MKNLKNLVASSVIGLGVLSGATAFAQDSMNNDGSYNSDSTTKQQNDTSGTNSGSTGGTSGGY